MTGGPVLVFGLGEVASAVAHRLQRDAIAVALVTNEPPKVHRRRMSFADVWWDGEAILAGLPCMRVEPGHLTEGGWPIGSLPYLAMNVDAALDLMPWPVAVDARLT